MKTQTERFDDDEVRLVRHRLLTRGAELRDRVQRVRADLRRAHAALPADSPDAAIAVENDEILEAIEESALSELDRIDQAMHRIDAGTFAVCEECGREIPAERMRIVPDATRCWDCER